MLKLLKCSSYFVILFYCLTVNAEIYKWTDKNGKVHFSDKKPELAGSTQTKQVNIPKANKSSNLGIPLVKINKPIHNSNSDSSKVIALEHIAIELDGVKRAENPLVGKSFVLNRGSKSSYSTLNKKLPVCQKSVDLKLNGANYIFKYVDFQTPFAQTLSDSGYNGFDPSAKKKFALQSNSNIDLSLAATIIDIKLAHCGSKYASEIMRENSKNSTYLKVKWELFDNLKRQIVYSSETEGVDLSFDKSARKNGAPKSMATAFVKSLENLLSQKDFVKTLSFTDSAVVEDSRSNSNLDVDINLSYGNSATKFTDKIDEIKKATATIRTTSGHGSGFVISKNGHVLTNNHVVEGSREVIVIIDGKDYSSEVLNTNKLRDIALLKIKGKIGSSHIDLNAKAAKLGEKIYVIGTPLDESLNFTITTGIISANRIFNSNSYYQTDAAVNPGNSGGPVFNESGNVIGVTVAGIFTRDGGSKNINYIIPIADALSSLDIE